MVNCLSMCNEVTLGLFFVTSAIILYESVFLATLLSNCQTWRNLNNEDYKKLEVTQLRYLKRVMKAPLSTPNAFVFLEFGALPVKRILHIRQLSFLHHIVCLDSDDPPCARTSTNVMRSARTSVQSVRMSYGMQRTCDSMIPFRFR